MHAVHNHEARARGPQYHRPQARGTATDLVYNTLYIRKSN